MTGEDRTLWAMAMMRVVSSLVEVTAAIVMLRLGKVTSALKVNAALGLFGPSILLLVTLIGVAGLAGKLPPARLLLILTGAALIFAATRT
jgi:hypothetical protein